MRHSLTIIGILLAALAPVGTASAVLFNFSCITFNDPSACTVGESQLTLNATAIGGDPDTGGVSLLFANTEQTPPDLLSNGENPNPSVTEIYFDTSLFTTQDDSKLPDLPPGTFNTNKTTLTPSGHVNFQEGPQSGDNMLGVSPPDLPGGNTIGFATTWAAEAVDPMSGQSTAWGIQEGESLDVRIFTLSLNMFLTALDAGDFGIGLHVRAFKGGGIDASESFVVGANPVPVPAAFWLFGTALIGFIGLSRRTRI